MSSVGRPRAKRMRSTSPASQDDAPPLSSTSSQTAGILESPRKAKKQKANSILSGESPFPAFLHPTPAEALEVYNLLSNAHGAPDRIRKVPELASSGEIRSNEPNVIEALISTILSQNTSGANSSRAKKSLDDAFGRNNFLAIATCPQERLVDAIRSGGLANKKAKVIQDILGSIKERHGDYSLQHLAAVEPGKRMTDNDIMEELVSYDGVGPKTASCVLLFCLGRDSFAVDTHIYRLSRVLGWIPSSSDRITAQAHLDARIPDDLKYGLHVLLIRHGRVCKGCKKLGSREHCLLKTHLKEERLTKTEID